MKVHRYFVAFMHLFYLMDSHMHRHWVPIHDFTQMGPEVQASLR